MTVEAVSVALGVLLVVIVLLVVVAAVGRAWRAATDRRRDRLAAESRPVLMRLVAGEGEESALVRLAGLDERRWRAVEPVAAGLLTKVSGSAHDALVVLLDRRGTLDRAVVRCGSRDAVSRARGAELLGAARRRDAVPVLVPLLGDRDPDVRQVAARALGRVGDPSAAGHVLAAVHDGQGVPARIATGALLAMGSGADPAVHRALSGTDRLARVVAVEVAGLAGLISAVPVLTDLMRGGDDPEVAIRCARALGRLGTRAAGQALAEVAARPGSTSLRAVAARALGEVGDPSAVPVLVDLLAAPEHKVAANAAAALVRCGGSGLEALAASAPHNPQARDAWATATIGAGPGRLP